MDTAFWKDKTVLVTGHTGFKGSWLSIWLISMGAKVIGYALDPHTPDDNFVLAHLEEKMVDIRGDIRDTKKLRETFETYRPEVVFHLAAQPLVLTSYENPVETYEVNVMGTLHVLECIRFTDSVKQAVMITTDKCYDNKETLKGYVETDPFGGYDPYSSSKACDEILIASYRNSYFPIDAYEKHHKAIASVRAGNVIGGGDWAAYRILPDCIRAIESGQPIEIRNKNAVRPFQHVLEPLSGYLMLAQKLAQDPKKYSGGWNFGPKEEDIWTVWDIAGEVIRCYGKGERLDCSKADAPHEAGKLTLNTQKAMTQLGWCPKLDVKQAVQYTTDWYRQRKEKDVYEICLSQIASY
ncbi:MAG: CDP-glucose 4,6-dehydratase [Eubacterium sp.]|nr:CDP-glucose 4,6-dehydratase [Eubacterium sp.]